MLAFIIPRTLGTQSRRFGVLGDVDVQVCEWTTELLGDGGRWWQ